MADRTIRRGFAIAARILLGTVFVVASVEKIAIPETFAASVEAYRLIPVPLINLFALFVPWLELICGLFLIAGVMVRGSAVLLSALLAAFIFSIVSALLRGLNIDCGCFGPSHSTPVGWQRVLEDVGLFVLGLYLIFYRQAPEPASGPAQGSQSAGGGLPDRAGTESRPTESSGDR